MQYCKSCSTRAVFFFGFFFLFFFFLGGGGGAKSVSSLWTAGPRTSCLSHVQTVYVSHQSSIVLDSKLQSVDQEVSKENLYCG